VLSTRRAHSARILAAGTSLRVVVLPVVMGLILLGHGGTDGVYPAAAALFALAAATDYFDGRLARRWGVATPFGSFLDTTADKLLVSGVLVALVAVGRASPWLAAAIIGRELVILGLRAAVAVAGTVIQPSPLGKWKATLQFTAIVLVILRPGDPIGPAYLDEWVLLIATAVTILSAIDYVARFSSAIRQTAD
jgi:CDP-diacylglycerol---glycerol-3-phosphate 3-phosphatidyltransferase